MILSGHYRLQGIEDLVQKAADRNVATGMDVTFLSRGDGKAACTVSAEKLAHFVAADDVDVGI